MLQKGDVAPPLSKPGCIPPPYPLPPRVSLNQAASIYRGLCCPTQASRHWGANSRGGRAAAEEKRNEFRPQGAYSLVFWREFLIPHSPSHIHSSKYLQHPQRSTRHPLSPHSPTPPRSAKNKEFLQLNCSPYTPHEILMRQIRTPAKTPAPLKGHLFQKNPDPSERKGGK